MLKHMKQTARILQWFVLIFFIAFLFIPLIYLVFQSVILDGSFSMHAYREIWQDVDIRRAITNSLSISFVASMITTMLAFLLAYTMHFTNVSNKIKKIAHIFIILPMLLPTITYGFVLIYTFGNQGMITKVFGQPLFSIYGYKGLLIGYILYTLPIVYILLHNSMAYIDKRYMYVSHLMHDTPWRRTYHTMIHPMIGSIGSAMILAFILSFTDFGIPASIGGEFDVVAIALYRTMLGSIVQLDKGAVIAITMLAPAIFALLLMQYLKKFDIQASEKSAYDVLRGPIRDICAGCLLILTNVMIIIVFIPIVIIPFTKGYPYDMTITFEHIVTVLTDNEFLSILKNSLLVALFTACIGTIIAFISALIHVRTTLVFRHYFNWIAMLTNAVPGMVLGIAYLFMFNGSSLKGTLLIIILSNVVHFYTTPFMMAKHALEKMDQSWEVTGALLQDSWLKTVYRIIIPNSKYTIFRMMHYYFVNAMVTVSGVIFLVGTHSSLLSTWIKELQHFAKFNEIFILSLIILFINISLNGISRLITKKEEYV